MKSSILGICALAATMMTFDVGAQPKRSGADVMCSKTSIGLSVQWATKEAATAKMLHEALGPEPVSDDYWNPRTHLLARQNWLLEKQLAATASQSAILANESMESLILNCEMLKRLGLGV